jgi:hypothetical protein
MATHTLNLWSHIVNVHPHKTHTRTFHTQASVVGCLFHTTHTHAQVMLSPAQEKKQQKAARRAPVDAAKRLATSETVFVNWMGKFEGIEVTFPTYDAAKDPLVSGLGASGKIDDDLPVIVVYGGGTAMYADALQNVIGKAIPMLELRKLVGDGNERTTLIGNKNPWAPKPTHPTYKKKLEIPTQYQERIPWPRTAGFPYPKHTVWVPLVEMREFQGMPVSKTVVVEVPTEDTQEVRDAEAQAKTRDQKTLAKIKIVGKTLGGNETRKALDAAKGYDLGVYWSILQKAVRLRRATAGAFRLDMATFLRVMTKAAMFAPNTFNPAIGRVVTGRESTCKRAAIISMEDGLTQPRSNMQGADDHARLLALAAAFRQNQKLVATFALTDYVGQFLVEAWQSKSVAAVTGTVQPQLPRVPYEKDDEEDEGDTDMEEEDDEEEGEVEERKWGGKAESQPPAKAKKRRHESDSDEDEEETSDEDTDEEESSSHTMKKRKTSASVAGVPVNPRMRTKTKTKTSAAAKAASKAEAKLPNTFRTWKSWEGAWIFLAYLRAFHSDIRMYRRAARFEEKGERVAVFSTRGPPHGHMAVAEACDHHATPVIAFLDPVATPMATRGSQPYIKYFNYFFQNKSGWNPRRTKNMRGPPLGMNPTWPERVAEVMRDVALQPSRQHAIPGGVAPPYYNTKASHVKTLLIKRSGLKADWLYGMIGARVVTVLVDKIQEEADRKAEREKQVVQDDAARAAEVAERTEAKEKKKKKKKKKSKTVVFQSESTDDEAEAEEDDEKQMANSKSKKKKKKVKHKGSPMKLLCFFTTNTKITVVLAPSPNVTDATVSKPTAAAGRLAFLALLKKNKPTLPTGQFDQLNGKKVTVDSSDASNLKLLVGGQPWDQLRLDVKYMVRKLPNQDAMQMDSVWDHLHKETKEEEEEGHESDNANGGQDEGSVTDRAWQFVMDIVSRQESRGQRTGADQQAKNLFTLLSLRARRRLLGFVTGRIAKVEFPAIGRDGGGTKDTILPEDGEVYRALVLFSWLYPSALRVSGPSRFATHSSPLLWHVGDVLQRHNHILTQARIATRDQETRGMEIGGGMGEEEEAEEEEEEEEAKESQDEESGNFPLAKFSWTPDAKGNTDYYYQTQALEDMRGKTNAYLLMKMGMGKSRIAVKHFRGIDRKGELPNTLIVALPQEALPNVWKDFGRFLPPSQLFFLNGTELSGKTEDTYQKNLRNAATGHTTTTGTKKSGTLGQEFVDTYKPNLLGKREMLPTGVLGSPRNVRPRVVFVLHRHLRLLNIHDFLEDYACLVDEMHKTIRAGLQITAATNSLIDGAKQSLGMTGTLIIDTNLMVLKTRLQKIAGFPITQKNIYVAMGMIDSYDVETGVVRNQILLDVPAREAMEDEDSDEEVKEAKEEEDEGTKEEREAYLAFAPSYLGGSNARYDATDGFKLWRMAQEWLDTRLLNEVIDRVEDGVLLVARDKSHEQKLKRLILAHPRRPQNLRLVVLRETGSVAGMDDPRPAGSPMVAIALAKKPYGFNATFAKTMVTGAYPGNQPDRDQMAARIDRQTQQRKEVDFVHVVGGLTARVFKNHAEAAGLAALDRAMRQQV